MKVCLIFPPLFMPVKDIHTAPPLGVYVLRNAIIKGGYEAEVLQNYLLEDECVNEEILLNEGFMRNKSFVEHIKKSDVLCLSCDSFNYSIALIMVKNARKINPAIKIIMGGLHPSYFHKEIIRDKDIDVVIKGEGEVSCVEVLDAFAGKKNLKDIKGITYLDENRTIVVNEDRQLLTADEIMAFGSPDFYEEDKAEYCSFPVETSRGCPYSCIFCSIPNKRSWRKLNTEYVISSIKKNAEYTDNIALVDDAFTIDTERAVKILDSVCSMDKKVNLEIEARVNNLIDSSIINEKYIDYIGKIQIGVECGYDEGLEKVGKKITTDDVIKACKKAKEEKISHKVLASFIIGFPWETTKECMKTIKFVNMLKSQYGINAVVNWWIPIPSKLWMDFRNEGIVDEKMFELFKWNVDDDIFSLFHKNITKEDKNKIDFVLSYMGI